MSRPVSVLDGEVNRNWHLVDSRGGRHLLSLLHDTVTGARAAMLDYEVRISRERRDRAFRFDSASIFLW